MSYIATVVHNRCMVHYFIQSGEHNVNILLATYKYMYIVLNGRSSIFMSKTNGLAPALNCISLFLHRYTYMLLPVAVLIHNHHT